MTYFAGFCLMLFCGIAGLSMDHEHAAEVAVALACLVILAAELAILWIGGRNDM